MIGKVIKGVGGFYYVSDGEHVIPGNARGILKRRKKDILYVGDVVDYEIRAEDGDCIITGVHPRKNVLKRPPVSNLDSLIIVFSAEEPEMAPLAVDKMCVCCEWIHLDVQIAITKTDLADASRVETLMDMYKDTYPVFPVSNADGSGIEALRNAIRGTSVALAGSSGVGKSSLLNRLSGKIQSETGDISDKTRRGKHTTRHVEIYMPDRNTYVYDTPGFTSLDLPDEMEPLQLRKMFPEFLPYDVHCRYGDCMHMHEPDCAVKEAVAAGRIRESRYQSYLKMIDEVRKWQR